MPQLVYSFFHSCRWRNRLIKRTDKILLMNIAYENLMSKQYAIADYVTLLHFSLFCFVQVSVLYSALNHNNL